MGHVGDRPQQVVDFGGDLVELLLCGIALFAQAATFFLAGFSLVGVFGLADRLADFVGAAVEFVSLALQRLTLSVDFDQPIDVGRDATVLAVGLYGLDVFDDIFAV